MPAEPVPVRPVRVGIPDPGALQWNRSHPELACVANAVSLLMPYAEPYVVKAVRAAAGSLQGEEHAVLHRRVRAYLDQEIQHHVQHRRYNDALARRYGGGVTRLERWLRATYGWLWRRRRPNFAVAFAAGFETVAFAAARWVDKRRARLLADVDPLAAGLFVWHLAEEVEHRDVAYDVYKAVHGTKRLYAFAMLVSLVILAWFTLLGTMLLLWRERLFWRPRSHLRLLRWGVSFAFEALPLMFVTATAAHEPADLAAPDWYEEWLAGAPKAAPGGEWTPAYPGPDAVAP